MVTTGILFSTLYLIKGKVVGFFDAFQAGRKFAMDMAGKYPVLLENG